MRNSHERAQKNRQTVIETAARLLRHHGFDGIGVADMMKEAGLTHGGFYRNFASKDDLVTQASAWAASDVKTTMAADLSQRPDDAFRWLVEHYVSLSHRDDPGSGCVLPALAADAARHDDPALRAVFNAVIQDYLDEFAKLAATMPQAARNRHPGAILSEMVGAVILSRVLADDEMEEQLVRAGVTDIIGEESYSNPARPG